MSVKPRYWDTPKGEVLKAIVLGERRTWNEIQKVTGYTMQELNKVLSELFISDVISKTGPSYWIEDYPLYCEYRDYLQGNTSSEYLTKEKQEEEESFNEYRDLTEAINEYIIENKFEESLVAKTLWWTVRVSIPYFLESEHFFIEGDLLDRVCKDVIDSCKNTVIVVNPFVDQCSLSDKLKTSGKDVTLVTRSPLCETSVRVRASRKDYHGVLHQNGVKIFYNNRIHSKIILADDMLGIVSSLNFKSESSSGKNLEAGLVTWQKETINFIKKYIDGLIKDYETIQYSG